MGNRDTLGKRAVNDPAGIQQGLDQRVTGRRPLKASRTQWRPYDQ